MWIIRDSSIPKEEDRLTKGDYHISDDGRAVYTVHKDGSLRRVKDKAIVAAAKERLKELKAKRAEEQLKEKAPLTHVDAKALMAFTAAAASFGNLPPFGLHRPARIGRI